MRQEGKDSEARRALTSTEFKCLISILRLEKDSIKKNGISAYFLFQYHMMARVDDIAHMKQKHMKAHADYPFVILAQMRWSKNMNEERKSPHQILFGSLDSNNCVILALEVHFETWIADGEGRVSQYMFGFCNTPDKTK